VRRRKRALLLLTALALIGATAGGGASGALVKVGSLVLRADVSFEPARLPLRSYAAIDLHGRADFQSATGGPPVALKEVTLDFDRDGHLETDGIPVCPLAKVAHADTAQARRRCSSSIVGTGVLSGSFEENDVQVQGSVPGTLFNGARTEDGSPTVIGHVHTTVPTAHTYAVVIPIESRKGRYSYRATVDIPTLAAGVVLSHVEGRIGLRYLWHERPRSYTSARCSRGVLEVHGHFLFADGTIIDGSIEKPCFAI
jgi:hypothetical protein